MIVIGRALVGMAVEHHLDGVMVLVTPAVVVVFMESEGED
jgi:hypothetical protein